METIIATIAMLGLIFAVIYRIIEIDEQERKRVRMFQSPNTKPWKRSNQHK